MNWYKVFSLFLWISPHVLLGILAVILYRRRLYRWFPCFFVYVLYEVAEFLLLFTLQSATSVTEQQYVYAYSATLLLSIALRFGMIEEVSRDLFRESPFLKVVARRSLQSVTGLLLVIGILLAVYAPAVGRARLYAGIFVVNRGAAVVQVGLLLALFLFSRFLGLSWRRPAFGIALGLGILTGTDLALFALHAAFTNQAAVEFLYLLTTGSYLVCVSIWIRYLLAPEPKPASLTVLPQNEVESWNKELQRLLGH